jgi:hypothetical protein
MKARRLATPATVMETLCDERDKETKNVSHVNMFKTGPFGLMRCQNDDEGTYPAKRKA